MDPNVNMLEFPQNVIATPDLIRGKQSRKMLQYWIANVDFVPRNDDVY
jgi:hypothetical protein